jgi:hypothetical protein
MIEFTINIDDKRTLKAGLRQPLFNDYRYAMMELHKVESFVDTLAAGSSLIQHCWVEGDESLKTGNISEDPVIATAYASLCNQVYTELYIGFAIEVKKK